MLEMTLGRTTDDPIQARRQFLVSDITRHAREL